MPQESNSHKQILKSTSIVGGAQVITILMGILRTKIAAILLGPQGIGMIGMLQATADIIRQATCFGINFSGVKEIADASASGDEFRISRTITILRSWAFYTGLLGMVLTIILCVPLSNYAFNNDYYALSIAIISITLLCTSLYSGQLALLQGLRQISTMAKASIYGALSSIIIVIPLYWWLKMDGIVPGMVLTAFSALLISWLYARKTKVLKSNLSFVETIRGGLKMAKLGFYIISTSLVVTIVVYAIRVFITQKMDIEAVGCFQAVWTITNIYISVILNSMLADFFPRLSAVSHDNSLSNKLINEQLEMAVVIAGPMLVLMISISSLAIGILYSSSFDMAIPVLQWQLLGGFLTIISWALGVMFLSKNKGIYALMIESVAILIYWGFVVFCWRWFGFISLGIGYVFSNIFKIVVSAWATHYLGGFCFSASAFKIISIFGGLTLLTFLNVTLVNGYIQFIISILLTVITICYSYSKISEVINVKEFFINKFNK